MRFNSDPDPDPDAGSDAGLTPAGARKVEQFFGFDPAVPAPKPACQPRKAF